MSTLGCDYQGYEFGAAYLDSVCIDGYLWDADSGDRSDDGWIYTNGGDLPCPKCNHETWREHMADDYFSDAYDRMARGRWPFQLARYRRDRLWAFWHQLRGAMQLLADRVFP